MKVIEKKDFSGWKYEFNCTRCESKLEAESTDLLGVYHAGWTDQRDNSSGPEYWTFNVECSVCNEKREVPITSIPSVLQHQVEKRTQRRSTNDFFDRW